MQTYLTSMLVLKALLTFALMFTTWPTLNTERKEELVNIAYLSIYLSLYKYKYK